MGNFDRLKEAIRNVVRPNGNNEITGELLQNVLLSIINSVGENATFAGIATPTTNPGSADQNIFYLATEAGIYANFGGITIEKGEAVILSNKSGSWVKSTSGFATEERLTELSEEVGIYKDINGYIRIYTDVQGRFLWGIKTDGSIEWAKGVPTPIQEYFTPLLDKLGSDIVALQTTINNALKEDFGYYVEDDNFIRKYVDANNIFLWGIKTDGSIEWAKGVPTPIQEYCKKLIQSLQQDIKKYDELFELVSKHFEILNYVEDAKWIYAIIDENKKVIFGIDIDGNVTVETKVIFSKNGIKELQKDLIESGFKVDSPVDWSKEKNITLPIPRYCAKVNIISETGLATSKTEDKKAQLEYFDKSGNYFKKYIIINAQGSSSMGYYEKNQSIDVYNDELCEESCEITFGNWVAQDSFHLKCYYIDIFRGIANIGYNYCEDVISYLNSRNNRIIFNTDAITAKNSTGNFSTDFGDGALCHPDGFPFELYVNGEYYGLFAWNLKKHRKNYSMNKNDYTQILLDGIIGGETLFGGNVDWTQFELRNPKDLITMDGRDYDADTNRNELIDDSSPYYDPNNSLHVKTAQCKALVKRQATAISLLLGETNIEDAKNIFTQFYDKRAMIVYFIISNVIHNYDGFWKNWIWTIYGNIAAPSFYDLDSIFGRNYQGLAVVGNSETTIMATELGIPTGQLVRLYKSEIDGIYSDLRKNGIISVDRIMQHVYQWIGRAGIQAIERNLKKWPSIPSYRNAKKENDGTAEGGMYDSPTRVKKWLENRIQSMDVYFNYNI